MKIEELINIHQQTFSTPSRIKDLKQYEIEELLIFSNQLKSAIKKKILGEDTSDLSKFTDEKIQEYFDRHPLYKRETVLQNFLTNALHTINTEGSHRLPESIDIYEFNVPDLDFYDQIIQSHYFEQKRKNQKNTNSDFIHALSEYNKVSKDAIGDASTQDSETLNFLRSVLNGKLSAELDIYSKAQTLTDNFEEPKLSLLWNEYLKLLNDSVSRNTYKSFEDWIPIDSLENMYKNLGLIIQNHLIKKSLRPEKKTIQPIHWLKDEKSLREFLKSINKAGLIEKKNSDDIIQEHILVEGKMPTKEPLPIKWLTDNKYLAYLMHRLAEEFIINIKGKKHHLTASHFISSEEKPLNINSLASQLSSLMKHGKPTNDTIKLIEKIIQQVKS